MPCFKKFEDIDNLINTIKSAGQSKEFIAEYLTLDFVMLYGGLEAATQTLLKMLDKRNWMNDFKRLIGDYEEGKNITDRRYYLTALIDRAIIYGLKIEN